MKHRYFIEKRNVKEGCERLNKHVDNLDIASHVIIMRINNTRKRRPIFQAFN